MLSATGITAALAILAISVTVFDDDPVIAPGAEAPTHVVAADGSGDFSTIQAAVEAAVAGDTIAVRPGTYTEVVTVDKDLTLFGDGPREEIILTAPEDGPLREVEFSWSSPARYVVLLDEMDGEIRDFTLSGTDARMFIEGGAPTVQGLLFDDVGLSYTGAGAPVGSMVIQRLAEPHVTGNEFVGGGGISAFGNPAPLIEGNSLMAGAGIDVVGDGAIVRGNALGGEARQGITFLGPSQALITDNTVADRLYGITTGESIDVEPDGTTFAPTIEGNTVSDAQVVAINLVGGSPQVVGNSLSGPGTAIHLTRSAGTIADHEISGFGLGIYLDGGTPSLTSNTITDNRTGILAGGFGAAPDATLEGNVVCDNETNLDASAGVEIDTTGNEICEDAPAE